MSICDVHVHIGIYNILDVYNPRHIYISSSFVSNHNHTHVLLPKPSLQEYFCMWH